MHRKSLLMLGLFLIISFSSFGTNIHFVTINDCHAIMEPFGRRDAITLEAEYGGYCRAVSAMDSLREIYPNIIAVHAGDVITGDFLSQLTIGRAMFDLWMSAGVEAFALGNHEFEYGPELLDSMLGTIDVPLLCANLDATGFPNIASSISPYIIVTYPLETPGDSVRIALIGVTTEETDAAGWTSPLDLSNAITAVETLGVPEDADCAIALEHLDISEDLLVAALPNIDVVIGGHDHSTLLEPEWAIDGVDSTPVVMAGALLRSIGHLTMDYIEGEGLSFVDWDVIPINPSLPEDSSARALLDTYRDSITANLGYDPYVEVAFVADSYIGNWSVAPSYSGYEDTPIGNLVTDAYRQALGTDIVVEFIGSFRMILYRGPVTYADLFRAMPMSYDPETRLNGKLVRIEFTGTELKQLIEYTYMALSFSPEAYPQFSGLSLAYDPDGSLLNKVDPASFYIGGVLWNPSEIYSIGANVLLLYAMDMLGFPYTTVDTSETTAYQALVSYCTDPDFEPVYHSEGRIVNLVTGIIETSIRPLEISLSTNPNPFNSGVRISVSCYSREFWNSNEGVAVEIFDIVGHRVVLFGSAHRTGGSPVAYGINQESSLASSTHEFIWQPDINIGSGVYLVCARGSGGQMVTKRLVYLK
ncbi:5'-nucleotidase C-terminal domain-containing protein [bacterium]|nr:5'-nucleotidase C-terminal domain-containing protein [bacterium]